MYNRTIALFHINQVHTHATDHHILEEMPIPIPTILAGLPASHLPLLLHFLIETPASLSFLLRPESQLPLLLSSSSSSSSSYNPADPSSRRSPSPITPHEATEARLILRNFGGLLLSVNVVTAYLLLYHGYHNPGRLPAKEGEELIRGVTGCLSLYHVFPLYRAWKRMDMNGFPASSCSSACSAAAAADENTKEKKGLKEGEGDKKEEKKKKKKEEEVLEEVGVKDETQKTLGGPVVHFVVHLIVGGLMGAAGLGLL